MSPHRPVPRARRSRAALAAALALGCGAAFAQETTTASKATDGAMPLAARRIVIDSVTGRPRLPDHEDFAAAKREAEARRVTAPAAAMARGAAAPPQFSSHPVLARMQGQPIATRFGTIGRRVGADKLSFSVVRRDADGTLRTQCAAGEDAVTHALHARIGKGGGDVQ